MKSAFIKKTTFVLLLTFFLSACFTSPKEQSVITPSIAVSTEITATVKPELQPAITATISPTSTPNSNLIIANSPDNKYTVELTLSETPITLNILDNVSKQKTQIPISYRNYNKIEGDDSSGFKWSMDNKIAMFVLYSEPYPEKITEDFSCFFSINIEQAKLMMAKYSSAGLHLWTPDGTGIFTLEHSGLNDIFDYYIPGTNCYKSTFHSECENSYVSPTGNWELSPWEENSDVTLTHLNGDVWKYSYPAKADKFDYLLTFVQGWTDNEKYVLFSPALGYSTSSVYGLFQMDLSNGNVISLLGKDTIDQPYYVSVSPHGTRIIFITFDRKAFIKDLSRNTETGFNISLAARETIGNFIWSPDETVVVFAKLKFDENNEIVSTDYLRLDTTDGELMTFLTNEPEYLNIMKITNSEVSFGQDTYSLVDGALLK